MMPSRGMGDMSPAKIPRARRRGDSKPVIGTGKPIKTYSEGGSSKKSKVNEAGNYTKPGMRKKLFESIKASATQGTKADQWSARKAQLLAKRYKAAGGGYKS
jgi:hypothetical protein